MARKFDRRIVRYKPRDEIHVMHGNRNAPRYRRGLRSHHSPDSKAALQFIFNLLNGSSLPAYTSIAPPRTELWIVVLDWLMDSFWLFGLHGQNWMPVTAIGLLAYIAGLIVVRRWQSHLH